MKKEQLEADFGNFSQHPLFFEIGNMAYHFASKVNDICPDNPGSNASRHKQIGLTTLRTALYSINNAIAQYERESARADARPNNLPDKTRRGEDDTCGRQDAVAQQGPQQSG